MRKCKKRVASQRNESTTKMSKAKTSRISVKKLQEEIARLKRLRQKDRKEIRSLKDHISVSADYYEH